MTVLKVIDDKSFEAICRLIYHHAGIKLTEKKRALVQARVTKRIRLLHCSSYKEYLDVLQKDTTGGELVSLIDAISTNVTRFFREKRHFMLLNLLLKKWEKKGGKRFRIWCAASSTGEEPYTLAITASEALDDLSNTKILATDISTEVLETARRGRYLKKALEGISRSVLQRYFEPEGPAGTEFYRIKNSLKQMVKFAHLNLSKTPLPLKGPIDVIFCRNVMIYFDNNVKRPLIDEFYRVLKPGGYLFVGHSESLVGIMGDFKRIQSSVYRKE